MLGICIFYFVASFAFLNTPLFHHATRMIDTSLTRVTFHWAFSFYPGELRASGLTVAVRDQNVSIDVDIRRFKLAFSPLALLKKQIRIRDFSSSDGLLRYVRKNQEQSAAFYAHHFAPQDEQKPPAAEIERIEHAHWSIHAPNISLTLSELDLQGKRIVAPGLIRIHGGFYLKPGIEAEIYPTALTVKNGVLGQELSGLDFQSTTAFHRYFIPQTNGSDVFRYFDTDIDFMAKAQNLALLNVTLHSLPGYRFQNGYGNLRGHLRVRSGDLLPGSFVDVGPGDIQFSAPSFLLQGKGRAHWEVPPRLGYSTLAVQWRHPGALVRLGKQFQANANLRRLSASVKLYGLNLTSAFHGLAAVLSLHDGAFALRSSGSNVGWAAQGRFAGKIGAVAGKIPVKIPEATHRLSVAILSSLIQSQSPPLRLEPRGRIKLLMPSIDFRFGRATFKGLDADLTLDQAEPFRENPVRVLIRTAQAQRYFPLNDGGTGRWQGSSNIEIRNFSALLDRYRKTLKIPSLVALLGKAGNVIADTEWEFADDGTVWVRAPSIRSSGLWSLWGTYLAKPSQKPVLALEAKVLGVPMGLLLEDGKTPLQVLPTTQWYDSAAGKPAFKR